ncbi:MAG TPA: polyprenyl synthetase family protein, partial [Rhizomicrobium sp.]
MSIAEATRPTQEIGPSPIDRLHALVETDMSATDCLIHERMGSTVELIPDLTRHLVDSGGKRLRPLLTLAAASICGHVGGLHVRLAAAV